MENKSNSEPCACLLVVNSLNFCIRPDIYAVFLRRNGLAKPKFKSDSNVFQEHKIFFKYVSLWRNSKIFFLPQCFSSSHILLKETLVNFSKQLLTFSYVLCMHCRPRSLSIQPKIQTRNNFYRIGKFLEMFPENSQEN